MEADSATVNTEKTEKSLNWKIPVIVELYKSKAKKSPTNPYTFDNFKRPATAVLYVIGIILWPRKSYWFHKWCLVNFIIAIISINIDIFCESYNQANVTTVLETTEYCVYYIYSFLSEVKILYLFSKLSQVNKLLKTFNSIFPVTKKQMAAYSMKEYHRKTLLLTLPPVLCMVTNVSFNAVSSLYQYFFIIDHNLSDDMGHILPFYPKYPFKVDRGWVFFATVFQQFHSSQMVVLSVTGSEALLTFIALQVCMHLNALSIRLNKRHREKGDIKDLRIIVNHHNLILGLMNDMNDTFKVPTFITFLTSAFSICFLGFLIMHATDAVVFLKFFIFISYDLIKLYIMSLLGESLIELSLDVGDSAYNTKWYENTIQYQKVIQLIICRSQKPANLNAITFHDTCLVTFKEVCSKSYTFFTVLHTMYNG